MHFSRAVAVFRGVRFLDSSDLERRLSGMEGYPAELCRHVLDLLVARKRVREVAGLSIYAW